MTISGLASGLDTESIIKQLMDIERAPLTRLQMRQNTIQVEKNAWQDIYSRMSSLNSKMLALTEASTFTSLIATSSDTAILTAQAGNSAVPGAYQIVVNQLAQGEVVQSVQVRDINVGLNYSGTVSINDKELTVQPAYSLATIRDEINKLQAGVKAEIIDRRLVLASLNTGGTAGVIHLAEVGAGTVLHDLGLLKTDGTNNTVVSPQDACFVVNGIEVRRQTNTVTDVLAGVTLNLAKADATKTVVLTIGYDTQKAKDAIKAFVDQYNSLMNFIADKTGDKGDLQGDPTLMRIKRDLWAKITDPLSNVSPGGYACLAAIGISTSDSSSSLNYNSAGALSIDDAKLSQALAENPAGVQKLFYNDSKTGVAQVVSAHLALLLRNPDGVIQAMANGLDRTLRDMDDQSQRLQDRLAMVEQRYRRQFVALEQALASLQSQGNWLAGQIAKMMPPANGV